MVYAFVGIAVRKMGNGQSSTGLQKLSAQLPSASAEDGEPMRMEEKEDGVEEDIHVDNLDKIPREEAQDKPQEEPEEQGGEDGGISAAQVLMLRSALRERLQNDVLNAYQFMGDVDCVDTLVSLFGRTIESGQNQSGLLIGSAGFGQKQIVASAMRKLRARCGPFTHVYLNGTIIQNEIEAFKEILAQLSSNQSIKHPVLSYNTMYSYLRSLLREKAEAKQPVLLILDGLEHFAHKSSAKQLLLYNLLDWLQFKDVQMGVLGVTEDYCIMDSLEKRVRSRFSKLQIVVPVRSFETMKTMLRDAFTVCTLTWNDETSGNDKPSEAFIAAFDQRVQALFGKSDEFARFQTVFEGLWDKSRSPAYFVRLAVSAASYLTVDNPILAPHHFQRALQLLEPDYQLATLRGISDNGIALLIGMSHLENEGHTFFTLEMVYRKWQDFFRKHDLLRTLPTRSEAQLELNVLIELKLVEDAGDPFRISRVKHAPAHFLQPEYRAVHLNFEPKTLQSMIRSGSIQCSTAMRAWMLNNG